MLTIARLYSKRVCDEHSALSDFSGSTFLKVLPAETTRICIWQIMRGRQVALQPSVRMNR
jgi:hypothetical protein